MKRFNNFFSFITATDKSSFSYFVAQEKISLIKCLGLALSFEVLISLKFKSIYSSIFVGYLFLCVYDKRCIPQHEEHTYTNTFKIFQFNNPIS